MTTSTMSPVLHLEIPAGARPRGFAYVHEVELDGDENLHVGSRVAIRDEGGTCVAATVDSMTADELGLRYRLRLGA